MCLGIPGKVTETYRQHEMLMGKVDFGGVAKHVCLEHVALVQPGQYVIVHAGFGLSIVDEEEARRIFTLLEEMDALEELHTGSAANDVSPADRTSKPTNRRPQP